MATARPMTARRTSSAPPKAMLAVPNVGHAVERRLGAGKAVREKVPRSAHGIDRSCWNCVYILLVILNMQ
jgi:hypothetical protein